LEKRSQMTTAAVLVGGLGTRLRSAVPDRPKALAEVNGKPFLFHVLAQLAEAGIVKSVLCIGHRAQQVRETMGNSFGPMELAYSQETELLGTGGALRLGLPMLDSEVVLVLNGDSYCRVDLAEFLSWHTRKHAEVSIVLTNVQEAQRYGSVRFDEHFRIQRFDEKSHSGDGWINAGIYAISRDLLAEIPEGIATSIERECFPRWVNRTFYGYPASGDFIDVGTPESYERAQGFFVQGADMHTAKKRAPAERKRFVFLDRDGTINFERHYLSDPQGFQFLPGAVEGLQQLKRLGMELIVITNQSPIGRGCFEIATLDAIHNQMRELLAESGVSLAGIYFCPHTPEAGCCCRKPAPGMIYRAAKDFDFDPRECFVIGDKVSDIEMGRVVGATTLLVKTGYGASVAGAFPSAADYLVADLAEAAQVIQCVLESRHPNAEKFQTAVN
jgi:D-glycero-alpha-D-manno-heptose 1-phosphate guanylyltransferase